MTALTKAQMADKLFEELGLNKREAKEIVEMFFEEVRGSLERLVPILMTALTAALALVPIVIEGEQPGNEILAPLSVVILGGLLTSVMLFRNDSMP